jgi:neuropeptide Y receptor
MLMATPIFFHTRLIMPFENMTESEDDIDWSNLVFCVEDWRFKEDHVNEDPERRIFYSIFSMAMQYVLPFVTMTTIYINIFCYLKTYRIVRSERPQDKARARRTNVMLATISLVFCLAWLPINLIGILCDVKTDLFGNDVELMTLTYIACHLVSFVYFWPLLRMGAGQFPLANFPTSTFPSAIFP